MDIIILGMGQTRSDCPYDTEVWGVNNGYHQVSQYNLDRAKAQTEIDRLKSDASSEAQFANKEAIEKYTNLLHSPVGKLDKLFICHRGQEYDAVGDPIFNWDEINQLVQQGVEIVSLFKVKQIPIFTRYPYRQIVRK